jgi:hypothetical protein
MSGGVLTVEPSKQANIGPPESASRQAALKPLIVVPSTRIRQCAAGFAGFAGLRPPRGGIYQPLGTAGSAAYDQSIAKEGYLSRRPVI